jgi:hypothetical protein
MIYVATKEFLFYLHTYLQEANYLGNSARVV